MFFIKIKNLTTGEVSTVNFLKKEDAVLYKKYHSVILGWDKDEHWKAEECLLEEDRNFVLEVQRKKVIDHRNITVSKNFYKIKPQFSFVEDNFTVEETIVDHWKYYRELRNNKLQETDWTQIADSPLDKDKRMEYRKYREYLRDSTTLYNDEAVIGALPKSFDAWLKGER